MDDFHSLTQRAVEYSQLCTLYFHVKLTFVPMLQQKLKKMQVLFQSKSSHNYRKIFLRFLVFDPIEAYGQIL